MAASTEREYQTRERGGGVAFFEYDNDGDRDLAVANGRVKRGPLNTRGGHIWIIACIEDAVVIEKILTYLDRIDASATAPRLPPRQGSAVTPPSTMSSMPVM